MNNLMIKIYTLTTPGISTGKVTGEAKKTGGDVMDMVVWFLLFLAVIAFLFSLFQIFERDENGSINKKWLMGIAISLLVIAILSGYKLFVTGIY